MDQHQSTPLDVFSAVISELDKIEAEAHKPDYLQDPVSWATERAGLELWSKQREVIESVRDNRRTAVQACHSVGKSYIAAVTACWWIDAHPPGEAFILTSAPTAPQVRAILWRNINQVHRAAGLPGRCNQTEWFIPTADGRGEELVGIGRKPSEHSEGAFQGIHARYVLVILDEGSGVPRALWDAAESIASNKNARVLTIGNPDVPTGPFADACKPESSFNVLHIGYEHSPAVTGEPVSERLLDSLISSEWAEDRKREWGEESALYQAKVLGQFPTGAADPWRVISELHVAECRYIEPAYDPDPVRVGGLDVGGGEDRTVLVERVNDGIGRIESFQERDPEEATKRLAGTIRRWGLTRVNVDTIGVGWGLAGSLRKELRADGVTIEGVSFAKRSNYPKRFANIRAEAWWHGRELARDGKWSLAGLDDDAIAELTMPRYTTNKQGQILIEPKDDVRERLGRSPDIADAVLLAFFDGIWVPPVDDSRKVFEEADLVQGGSDAPSIFGGPMIPGLPISIPTSLTQR